MLEFVSVSAPYLVLLVHFSPRLATRLYHVLILAPAPHKERVLHEQIINTDVGSRKGQIGSSRARSKHLEQQQGKLPRRRADAHDQSHLYSLRVKNIARIFFVLPASVEEKKKSLLARHIFLYVHQPFSLFHLTCVLRQLQTTLASSSFTAHLPNEPQAA